MNRVELTCVGTRALTRAKDQLKIAQEFIEEALRAAAENPSNPAAADWPTNAAVGHMDRTIRILTDASEHDA